MSNEASSHIYSFAAQQNTLRERLHLLLALLHPALHADVLYVLQQEGKLLSPSSSTGITKPSLAQPAGVWPLLTFLVVQHVNPDIDLDCASSVAVAIECFICALDLLDDIEDEDQTPVVQMLGKARTLNISTTLLTLAHKALLSLSDYGVAPKRILKLLDALQADVLLATAGQHRDLLAEQSSVEDFTYEECIEIAAEKAGSLMRMACHIGALCAGADDEVCEQFAQLGELLGIAHQLDNDCHDLYHLLYNLKPDGLPTEILPVTSSIKSDLSRCKKTLPVVLAASKNDTFRGSLLSLLIASEQREEYFKALSEGIVATWGICLLYREYAHDHLQLIEAQRPVAPYLRLLLGL